MISRLERSGLCYYFVMLSILNWLVSFVTFPGVVFHEWAHKTFCQLSGVRVFKVIYFRFGNPAGFVSHEEPRYYFQNFWISVGPLVINSLVSVLFTSFALRLASNPKLSLALLWLAVSAGMHAFPSNHDMRHISYASRSALGRGGSWLHYLSFPFVGLVILANELKFFWFDFVYALLLIALGIGLTR